MGDGMHQPRDENGQWVNIGTLFERERQEHMKDHDRERIVAKETADRLAGQVVAALVDVEKTARLHAVAHSENHEAHERIHVVEKEQHVKADADRRREADLLKDQLKEFKDSSNEWRGALRDQRADLVSRQQFEAQNERNAELFEAQNERLNNQFAAQNERLITLEKRIAYYSGFAAAAGAAIALIIRLLTT